MSKVATTARWSSAIIGGALVVALQTPPDTAVSNAALWIKKITGYLPDLPPWADALGTAFGILLILTPIGLWAWKRWRMRNRPLRGDLPIQFVPASEHVIALATAVLGRAEKRIKYATEAADPNTGIDLNTWFRKVVQYDDQRVEFEGLAQADTEPLTLKQKIAYQTSLDALRELDRFINGAIKNWRKLDVEPTAGRYLNRAEDIKKALQGLLSELGAPGTAEPVRDVHLGEAIAFIAYRAWGHEYSQTVVDMFLENAPNYLKDFQQLAFDKKVTVWGRLNGFGVYRRIPPKHWGDHHVNPQALVNGYAKTWGNDTTYYDHLMVSKAQFEELPQWRMIPGPASTGF